MKETVTFGGQGVVFLGTSTPDGDILLPHMQVPGLSADRAPHVAFRSEEVGEHYCQRVGAGDAVLLLTATNLPPFYLDSVKTVGVVLFESGRQVEAFCADPQHVCDCGLLRFPDRKEEVT